MERSAQYHSAQNGGDVRGVIDILSQLIIPHRSSTDANMNLHLLFSVNNVLVSSTRCDYDLCQVCMPIFKLRTDRDPMYKKKARTAEFDTGHCIEHCQLVILLFYSHSSPLKQE